MPGTELPALPGVLWQARQSAFAVGEFIGQESFVTATEVRDLARAAGISPGISVLDLCCGTGGPGRLLVRELGCGYLGVDASPSSIAVARTLAAPPSPAARAEPSAPPRYRVACVPPLPAGSWEVVVLLETLLAFSERRSLVASIAAALPLGGRFAFTVEEGAPLTPEERLRMPAADTVWLTDLSQLLADLAAVGLEVRWQVETSRSHGETAAALAEAYAHARRRTGDRDATGTLSGLVRSHRLWADWLASGRVRKFALVTEKVGSAGAPSSPGAHRPAGSRTSGPAGTRCLRPVRKARL